MKKLKKFVFEMTYAGTAYTASEAWNGILEWVVQDRAPKPSRIEEPNEEDIENYFGGDEDSIAEYHVAMEKKNKKRKK